MTDDQNLIKEIDEEVKQDDYKRLWNKYKKYIFILIITLLIIVTSINIFKYNKEKKIEKQSELFFQATQYIEQEDYQNAEKILRDINNGQESGYSDLAFLYILDLVNKKKENLNVKNLALKKEAKKIFDVINNKKYKFSKRTKDNDELYGSLKPKELSKTIENIEKIEIKPSQIDLGKEIKKK